MKKEKVRIKKWNSLEVEFVDSDDSREKKKKERYQVFGKTVINKKNLEAYNVTIQIDYFIEEKNEENPNLFNMLLLDLFHLYRLVMH